MALPSGWWGSCAQSYWDALTFVRFAVSGLRTNEFCRHVPGVLSA